LTLARFDPELEETVSRIGREIGAVTTPSGPPAAPGAPDAPGAPVAPGAPSAPGAPDASAPPPRPDLIDFDALLASLGVPDASPPPLMEMLLPRPAGEGTGREFAGPPGGLPAAAEGTGREFAGSPSPDQPPTPVEQGFADLQRELRAFDPAPVQPQSQETAVAAVVEELESWLRVLQRERATQGA
jgi:hypothetical protein